LDQLDVKLSTSGVAGFLFVRVNETRVTSTQETELQKLKKQELQDGLCKLNLLLLI
jgi:hypothetical protein